MFTFTFRADLFANISFHQMRLATSEIWRRFNIYYSRNLNLSHYSKDFRYVKVTELTQNKIIHFHVVVDRYFPLKIANAVFWHAINQVLGCSGRHGNIHMSKIKNDVKNCASYIAKYVTKTAEVFVGNTKFRKWSKNKKGGIFPKKVKSDWQFFNARGFDLEGFSPTSQETGQDFSILEILDFDFIEKPPIVATDEQFWEYFL
jgi:hypothetical protein